jgi:hypothetical protein
MSEEIFSVTTPFPDVASLAQGYMNRADGERLLLPLPMGLPSGAGVRFVVYLADGTPAFAGAGLCSQASDQGDTVPPEQRYETLLDTLNFDERSRPVYEYIVAVRNAAYAQQEYSEEAAPAEIAVEDVSLATSEPAPDVQAHAADDDEPTVFQRVAHVAPTAQASMPASPADYVDVSVSSDAISIESIPSGPGSMPVMERQPSFVPPPIPTGLLTRPARAMHWQPAPPRRPTPRPSTGLFRYGASGLPRPAKPPHPELDPALKVTPAPKP